MGSSREENGRHSRKAPSIHEIVVRKLLRRIVQYWPLFPHLLVVLLLLWGCAYFALTSATIAIAVAIFYLYVVDIEQKKLLRVHLERSWKEECLHLQQTTRSGSVETWLNVLLKACWPAWEAGPLCRFVEAKLVELLEPKRITLERIHLGSSAPLVHSCRIWLPRSQAEQHYLSSYDAALDIDLSFVAGDDMGVVLTVPVGYFGAKLFLDNLTIACKLRLGLKFVAFFPYISYLTVSSLTVPSLKLSVRPLSSNSLAVTDLPIIASWVTNSISMAIQTCGLVHPDKWEFDFIQWWGTDYGLGPTLAETKGACYAILEIIEGRDLMAKDLSGFSDPYVIVTHRKHKFKTQTRKQTLNPTWHECFRIDLAPEFCWDEKILLRCRDRDLIMDDELGSYELELKLYRDGKRHEVLCKLQNADSGQLLIAITVVGGKLPQPQEPSMESVESSTTVPPQVQQHIGADASGREVRAVKVHAQSESSKFLAVDHKGAHQTTVIDASHSSVNVLASPSSSNIPIVAGTSVASIPSPSGLEVPAQRSLSALVCYPSNSAPESSSGSTENIGTSGNSTESLHRARPSTSSPVNRTRRSVASVGRKPKRATQVFSPQSRRSTLFLDTSSARSSHSSTSSNSPSQRRARSSIAAPSVAGSSTNGKRTSQQLEKGTHSKTWKRNLFNFAFSKSKQKRQPRS